MTLPFLAPLILSVARGPKREDCKGAAGYLGSASGKGRGRKFCRAILFNCKRYTWARHASAKWKNVASADEANASPRFGNEEESNARSVSRRRVATGHASRKLARV